MSKQKKIRGWRPWKPEEAIGKRIRETDTDCLHVITDAGVAGCTVGGEIISYTDILDMYERLDGTRCGVYTWIKIPKVEPGLGAMW